MLRTRENREGYHAIRTRTGYCCCVVVGSCIFKLQAAARIFIDHLSDKVCAEIIAGESNTQLCGEAASR